MHRTARRIASYRAALAAGVVFGLQAAVIAPVAFAQNNPLERSSENPLERTAPNPEYHGPVLELPLTLEGDGLTFVMEDFDQGRAMVVGHVRLGGSRYPFEGVFENTTRLAGSFDAGGRAYDFALEGEAGQGYLFTTGQSKYRLRGSRGARPPAGPGDADQRQGGADPGELKRASDAMVAQDFAAAMRIARPLAERGHVGACYLVGACHAFGMGVEQDLDAARRYFETAARGDHPRALFELGTMASEGVFGEPDDATAVKHFGRAARLGNLDAIMSFGEMTLNGIGCQEDFVEGIAWVGVAARRGHQDAQGMIDYYNDDKSVSREDRARVGERIAALERELPDAGKLDDLVDYNRFVTPVAARDTGPGRDERPRPAVSTIAGEWAGTLSEEMDDGQMVRCPISITIAEGSHGGCTADLRVDVRMPGQDGQMYDVRATGRFQGSVEGGRGSLRANDTTMTVLQTGETGSMGAQQLDFTVSGGTISGRLGNDYEGWSRFQATRTSPPPGGSGGSNTGGFGSHTPDARGNNAYGEQSWNSGRGASAELERPVAARGEKSAASVTLEPVTLTDPTMGNAPSHRLLVPVGWEQRGGVKWNPPQLYQDMVHLDLRVNAPDGTSYGYYPGGNYTWSDVYEVNAMLGVPGSGPPPQPGQITGDGLMFMPMPQTTGDYVQGMLIPQQRPGATDVRVTEASEMPEVIATMREMLAPTMRSIQQNNAMMGQYGGQMNMSPFADRVRVTYTENGQRFEEDVFVTGYVVVSQIPIANGQAATMARWGVEDIRTVRSPAGREGNRAIADAASLSVRPDPKWLATVIDMRAQINKTVSDGIAERGRINRQAMEESFKRHQEAVRAQEESNDRLHHQFINYIREVEDYKTPSGAVVQLPSQYNNAYMNGQGQVVMTNTPLSSTSGWTQLNRVTR